MNVNGPRVFSTAMVLTCLLVGGAYPLAGAVQEGKKTKEEPAKAPQLVEAFMKGPVSISARVVRSQGTPEEAALPLFQVPVLKFEDKLELSFAGEAFDQRVTSADWSLVVVFLPKTVAPTDQGVVSFKLKHKVDRMVVPVISVPYDSVPMLFLIPDKNGRKKVLKDLNDHLESFRTLCAKIADLAAERATVDKFIEDLDAIDKNMSPVQYDSALLGFLHTYGSGVSVDVQAFAGGAHSNLDRCQFVTQEFQKTNILVPDPSAPAPATGATQAVAMTGGGGPVSAYVSIFFDVATIISNLWPGHQFQYLPALARNFHDSNADLYYTDWIHTTGDTLGALMCCPGKWEDQTAPSFDLELPKGESLLKKQVLLKARTKEHSRAPFSLFGHDWKLLVAGPKGESLPPLPLTISPSREAFVATPAPLLEPLAKLGATKVKVRVVGRWGFTSIATEPLEVPAGCDPGWMPTSEETTAFQIGKDCSFTFSADWADTVDKVRFRSSAAGSVPMEAKLKDKEDGTRVATFEPKGEAAGKGMLEITTFGATKPALSRPMALLEALPEITAIEARQGDTTALLKGQHLSGIKALELEGRAFLPAAQEKGNGSTLIVKAVDGKPFDAGAGKKLAVSLTFASGTREHLDPATLLPPRPRLGEALVIPMGVKGSGLMVTSTLPIAAAGSSSQVCLLAAKGYQFPSDGAFHVAIRNVEEPNEVRSIPSTKLRVMGHNQKSTFSLTPSDLLGGRASGKLEVQIVDDHTGVSDWKPLPPSFLDLPVILAVQAALPGVQLIGPALDPIEAIAPSPDGPWEKVGVDIEDGHEAVKVTAALPGNTCFLKIFGWPDLVLTLNFPPLPTVATKLAPTGAGATPAQVTAPPAPLREKAPMPGLAPSQLPVGPPPTVLPPPRTEGGKPEGA